MEETLEIEPDERIELWRNKFHLAHTAAEVAIKENKALQSQLAAADQDYKDMCEKIDESVDAINEMQEVIQPKESNPLVFLRECETKARLEGKIEGVEESQKIYHSYQAGEIDSCNLALMEFLSRLKVELKKLKQ